MDVLINADERQGFGCRRKVFDVFFNNEAGGENFLFWMLLPPQSLSPTEIDHKDCDPTLLGGCARCLISRPTVCCDIHHPNSFTSYISTAPKLPKAPARSRIAKFSMATADYSLLDALEDWRETKTAQLFGHAHLHDLGPGLVMTDSVVDRIVNCAHHHKIKTASDLKKETRWIYTDKYGDEVVTLILRLAPLPVPQAPLVSTPLQPCRAAYNVASSSNTPARTPSTPTPAAKPRKKTRCGACGEEGHNGMLF
ncbi:hypothetical protein BV22DRAFT_1026812 [Leucogyrophana mollusca]|uniref:Uncharacterized protein n=1 Tax=Leucogyrophana mollusca TaxID=85980 RepID=A0ACB8AV09_9AGAM|nr:hypothetical protein BV22DRAFT_1026812 [Leucogyrophana mollusca]